MNIFQRYLAEEFAEDYEEGRISRREALKLITSVTGSLIAANSILAACAPRESTETSAASPTDSPTAQPTRSEAASPAAESVSTEASAPSAAYGTVMPNDPAVIANEVQIPAADTSLIGYLARPSSEAPAPVILVCHENRGLTPHIQDVTRRLAKAGYVGLAIDLLSRQGGTATIGSENVPGALGNIEPDQFVEDFKSGWRYLQGQPFAPADKVGMTGFCFGGGVTWRVAAAVPELRAAMPFYYPIRHYPDITHSRQAQYPAPDWDLAYSVTEGREVINPRPTDEATIFRLLQPYTMGFLTYSEGCNDDVNKFVWSALGWDPEADVTQVLREYSRYFIGPRYADSFAQGLLALERNWRGPLATNSGVDITLRQFQEMERSAAPQVLANWRFQQALYRAYYDAYTRSRLLYETELEQKAMFELHSAKKVGTLAAMDRAEEILDRAITQHTAVAWRARIFELAEALFQSIRMQLSVPLYKAISVDRGANLDTVDAPLNSRVWLKQTFADVRAIRDEPERLKDLDRIVSWTDPGPGGFYDDLGNLAQQAHLVRGLGYQKDPAFLESSLVGFSSRAAWPSSWWTHAESLVDAPLRMHYQDLDPSAQYKIRVVYAGDSARVKIRLMANDSVEIHPLLEKPAPVKPLEFDIPQQATSKGELNLSWYREAGLGGNGRGCQVAEVWLIRK